MPYFEHQGRSIYYREQGKGPLLLILPGNTASSAHHLGELAHFGPRFRAIAPDPLGTGRSDRLAAWPTDWHEQTAHDMAALISHLGASSAYVMGTSGGGVIALLMAALYPGRVRGVVADSCTAFFPPEHLPLFLADRGQRTPGQQEFWRAAHGDDWAEVVKADTDMLRRFGESGGDWFHGRLAQITCPVLLTISLADDLLYDPAGQVCAMVRQTPSSRALLFPEGAHPVMWSRPVDFRRAADEFLASLR